MPDLEDLETAAAVENPLLDTPDMGWQAHFCQVHTLEKRPFFQYLQGLRKFQLLDTTEIESVLPDTLQAFLEPHLLQCLTAVERPVADIGKLGRQQNPLQ